jgi:hypothetical protein
MQQGAVHRGDTPTICLVRPARPCTHLAASGLCRCRLEAGTNKLRPPHRAQAHHHAVRADARAGPRMRLLLLWSGLRRPAPTALLAGLATGGGCRGRGRLRRLRREHHDQVAELVRAVERAHVVQQSSGVALHLGAARRGIADSILHLSSRLKFEFYE